MTITHHAPFRANAFSSKHTTPPFSLFAPRPVSTFTSSTRMVARYAPTSAVVGLRGWRAVLFNLLVRPDVK